jgi:hypothetical protein
MGNILNFARFENRPQVLVGDEAALDHVLVLSFGMSKLTPHVLEE